jgi:hypothetical protein
LQPEPHEIHSDPDSLSPDLNNLVTLEMSQADMVASQRGDRNGALVLGEFDTNRTFGRVVSGEPLHDLIEVLTRDFKKGINMLTYDLACDG